MFYQTQTARMPMKPLKNAVLSLVTSTFDLDLQTRPSDGPCEFGANPFSGSRYISYTNKKHRLTEPKTEPSAVYCMQ